MSRDPNDNSSPRVEGGYHVERLDDVSTRVARIEGKLESVATKEDVANAKFNLLASWVGIGVAITIGVVTVVLRIWPTGS